MSDILVKSMLIIIDDGIIPSIVLNLVFGVMLLQFNSKLTKLAIGIF